MHSRIFQLSSKRLHKDDWIDKNLFDYDDCLAFGIDYTDETIDRKEDIAALAAILPKEVFKLEEDTITIVGDPATLWEDYKKRFINLLQNMRFSAAIRGEYDSSWCGLGEYKIRRLSKNFLDTDFRFYFDEWSGWSICQSNTLLAYAQEAWEGRSPKTLYIGGVLHFAF